MSVAKMMDKQVFVEKPKWKMMVGLQLDACADVMCDCCACLIVSYRSLRVIPITRCQNSSSYGMYPRAYLSCSSALTGLPKT